MKHIGQFRDNNDNEYTITIVSNGDDSTVDNLILGDSPILTEIEGGDDNLFKPVKYSSATVTIVTDRILNDLYSASAQGTSVTLTDEKNNIKWVGYLTPSIYTQPYESDADEVELEAIDGLSTLQYYDYSTPKKQFKSFTTIISELLKRCNCYNYFYLPYSYQPDKTSTVRFYSKCQVTEANFFDEDGEPMKCDEVLEELCKFMGLTAVANGNNVYFIDYDSIKTGKYDFYKIKVGAEDDGQLKMMLQSKLTIDAGAYTENGTTINLGPVYSKITVKDSLYSADSIIPELDNIDYLKNRNGNEAYEMNEVFYIADSTDKTVLCNSFNKYYDHCYYKPYYYDNNLQPTEVMPKKYDDLLSTVGATVVKNFSYAYKEFDEKDIPKLEWTPYILITNNNKQDGQIRKLMNIEIPNPLAVTSKNSYLVMNFSAIFNNRNKIDPNTTFAEADDIDKFDGRILGVDFIIKYGNSYYNGNEWTANECTCTIPLECGNILQAKGKEHLFHRKYSVKNNIQYDMNLDCDTGWAIKLPVEAKLTDEITISILQPLVSPLIDKSDNPDKTQELTAIWLSDFNCEIVIPNVVDDSVFDSDTEYSNVINATFVNDYEGEEFLICTFDGKMANYSSVVYSLDDTHDKYLDKIYHKGTREYLRSEEHFINRLLRQYSTPCYILEASLHNNILPYTLFTVTINDEPTKMVVDSQSIDWRQNVNNVKLIEKK